MSNDGLEQWRALPDMSTKRVRCAAAATGNKLYVVGGRDNRGNLPESADVYDIPSKTWTCTSDMSTGRWGCVAGAVGDKIYVAGGYDYSFNPLSSAEVYDISSKSWTSIAEMGTSRCGCGAAPVGNKFYVIGGYDDNRNILSSAEVYDTLSNTWTPIASMGTERSRCAAAALGDKIYVIGGYDGEKDLSSAEVYDIPSNTWMSIASMSTKRARCAAVAVDKNIYVVGGYDSGNPLASAVVYDVSSNKWTSIANMGTKRGSCAAAAVDNRIYILGGKTGKNYLASVEMLDTEDLVPNSLFYEELFKPDQNLIFKISKLVSLIEDVYQTKLIYTLINSLYRLKYIDKSDQGKYLKEALEKASKTNCIESIAIYKIIVDKAATDGIIDAHIKDSLNHEAQGTHTSNTSYVNDIWLHFKTNTGLVKILQSKTGSLESRMEKLSLRTESTEGWYDVLGESLIKLHRAIKSQRETEAAVALLGIVLNAFSFGITESARFGSMSSMFENIVDYCDLSHIEDVVDLVGDDCVHEALKEALDFAVKGNELINLANEGSHILHNPSHRQVIDRNPLAVIALTAQIVSSN